MTIAIDKFTWYENRGIYAGKHEVMIHFVYNNLKQDMLTCFEKVPDKTQVTTRLSEIKARLDIVPVVEVAKVDISTYTPKQVYDMVVGKVVDDKTTWTDVLQSKLTPVAVVK